MSLSNLLKLGLHKSSCILFSCLFFVSCNTASSKPTEVVSNAGSRKIASASAAAMAVNSSAFLMMQACPVLASIQSRIPSWRGTADRDEHINRYNAEYVMNMLQETDSQGRTFHQRLMLELSSDSDCLGRIGDLRENICFYREYSEACDALHKIDKLDGGTIIQEFEEFAGASIESIDLSQLAGKIDEFIKSRGFFSNFLGREEKKEPSSHEEAIEQLEAERVKRAANVGSLGVLGAATMLLVLAVPTAVLTTAAGVVGVAGLLFVVGGTIWAATGGYDKRIKNRKRPRRQ